VGNSAEFAEADPRCAQGNAVVTLEFEGALHDPVPSDLALELGQSQATPIKDRPPV
jgi:hypothetical protein